MKCIAFELNPHRMIFISGDYLRVTTHDIKYSPITYLSSQELLCATINHRNLQ